MVTQERLVMLREAVKKFLVFWGVAIKFAIKFIIAFVNWPILVVILPVLPFRTHAYIAGVGHGKDKKHFLRYLLAKFLVVGNIKYARKLLNTRILNSPENKRRDLAKEIWTISSVTSWGQRAFENTARRSKNYAYVTTQEIFQEKGRPLRILEFGCMNGGSLHCLQYLGIEVGRYVGVDNAQEMIKEAKDKYRDEVRYQFLPLDFLDYCKNVGEKFDLLIIKQTFCFLDQQYFEEILHSLSQKRIIKRIVLHEIQLRDHAGEESVQTDFGNIPVDYSHNYFALMERHGFKKERGGLVDRGDDLFFVVDAVFVI